MSEDELLGLVVDEAERNGHKVFHVRDSRSVMPGGKGFPDLVIVGVYRVLFVELKRQHESLKQEQIDWMYRLRAISPRLHEVWRPADWQSGLIPDLLRLL